MEEILALDALQAAPHVLGMKLIHDTAAGRLCGRIVEIEVYRQDDPASHSFKGHTARTAPMFGPPGTIYIYFTYGMHYCMNIVTGQMGAGEALLIRALEPLEGIEIMKRNRRVSDIKNLCNGPAKLVQALGITKDYNGKNFFSGPLRLELSEKIPAEQIIASPRIGISRATEKLWRFSIKDNLFVSR